MLICQELETLTYNTQLKNIDPLVNIFLIKFQNSWESICLISYLGIMCTQIDPNFGIYKSSVEFQALIRLLYLFLI